MHMHGYWIFGLLFLHFINYLHPCIGITANILIKVGPVMDPYRCHTESIWTAVGLFPVEFSR